MTDTIAMTATAIGGPTATDETYAALSAASIGIRARSTVTPIAVNGFYGAPSAANYDDPYFDPGYRAWRRGDRLPSYYRDRYDEVDWRDCGLQAPPRGYHYVEDDRGNYLLVAIATGVILSVLLSDN